MNGTSGMKAEWVRFTSSSFCFGFGFDSRVVGRRRRVCIISHYHRRLFTQNTTFAKSLFLKTNGRLELRMHLCVDAREIGFARKPFTLCNLNECYNSSDDDGEKEKRQIDPNIGWMDDDDDDDVHEWAGYAHRMLKLHTVQISFYLRQNTHICVHNLALSFSLHFQLHYTPLHCTSIFYGGFTIHGVNMIVQTEPTQH